MRFENQIAIRCPIEKVWQFLWDVERFMICVPGCQEARTLETGKRYAATMVERVGPFRVEFPMQIEVIQSEPMSYIKAQATGSDSRVGSRMKVELEARLKADGEGSTLSFVASVDILGKLATLGHGIVQRKADQAMEQFARAVKEQLEGAAQNA